MSNVKCECGHQIKAGTEFCESCGKPITLIEGQKLLNMRYEGVARRSKTSQKTIVDKIWNFFSSVKVGIWIIFLTLVASAIGTFLPQEMYIPQNITPADFYKDQYGTIGFLFYSLGFHNLYGSWWYMLLLASMGLSLIIASLDRVVPLYRALKKQRVTRHDSFLKRQRIFGVTPIIDHQESIEKVSNNLKEKRYKVRKENGNILAEKGRFSRWGPYVNHLGLIIVLIGAMLRFFPGMYVDEILWVRDGETETVPGTDRKYYIKNEKFIFETYGEEDEKFQETIDEVGNTIPKTYQTNAILYKNKNQGMAGAKPELVQIKEGPITVNNPMKIEGFAFYQTSYRQGEFHKMRFELEEKESGETFGNIELDLLNPKTNFDLGNGYRVEVLDYFPDFEFDSEEGPITKSSLPNNPAFIFKMFTPETPEGETSFVAIQQNLEPLGENQYKMTFSGLDVRSLSGLTIRKDHTLWILGIGGFIFMIGLIQGLYWNHRRVWVQVHGDEVLIAAHTSKNWYGIKKDIEYVVESTGLNIPADQAEDKGEKKND
ncbi:cytochrome c biogenesis protein ResB [Rossellomorea aquimaris]|uniref:Cytochrome c biogenesis protein n=1 Tax=Rossellomorea aquimaris TaxID=189382 RepID=A0A366ESH3_9BACI|nr:cytochrome c biogenesis protein ResB [Rossellomorea aquimaris]RBP05341.1 cytochrome c biogenesis protein [Rossellomorea aquimaris]